MGNRAGSVHDLRPGTRRIAGLERATHRLIPHLTKPFLLLSERPLPGEARLLAGWAFDQGRETARYKGLARTLGWRDFARLARGQSVQAVGGCLSVKPVAARRDRRRPLAQTNAREMACSFVTSKGSGGRGSCRAVWTDSAPGAGSAGASPSRASSFAGQAERPTCRISKAPGFAVSFMAMSDFVRRSLHPDHAANGCCTIPAPPAKAWPCA